MDVLDNKCPMCTAKIDFNPVNQMWDCKYCGGKFTLEEMQQHSNASSEVVNIVSNNPINNENIDVYRCKNCGAEIIADQTTTATFCVYCGSTAILKDRIEQGKLPNYIIPFKNVKEDAIKAFKSITNGKPLAPRCFKNIKNIQKITGVYIPFWAYDFEVSGPVEFSCTDIKRWSEGQNSYKQIDSYLVKKSGKFEFKKVLADASSRFPNDLMDSLEPFDYEQLVDYNHAYLSGFLAEKYDVLDDVGLNRASSRTNDTAVSLIANSIRHQYKKVTNNQLSVINRNTYYVLLPVWMVNIKYRNKNYTFAMNGQTGKIVGDIPIGIKETIKWAIGIFIVLFVLGYIGLKYM